MPVHRHVEVLDLEKRGSDGLFATVPVVHTAESYPPIGISPTRRRNGRPWPRHQELPEPQAAGTVTAMADPWTYAGPVAAAGAVRRGRSPWSTSPPSPSAGAPGTSPRSASRAVRAGHPDPLPVRTPGQRSPDRTAVGGHRRSLLFHVRLPVPAPPGRADSTLMVFRSRYVGQGMREDIAIRNFGDEPSFCSVELFVGVRLRRPVRGQGGTGRPHTGESPTVDDHAVGNDVTATAPMFSYRRGRGGPRAVAIQVLRRVRSPGRRGPRHLRDHRARPRRVEDLRRGGSR